MKLKSLTVRKTILLCISFLCGIIQFAYSQSIGTLGTDSSKYLMELTDKAKKWSTINIDSALYYAQEATSLAYEIDHKEGLRANLMVLGMGFSHLKEHQKALEVFDRVCFLIQEEGPNPVAEIEVMNQMGEVYRNTGQFSKALIKHQDAMNLAKQLAPEEKEKISTTLFYLGKLYKAEGKDSLALETQLASLTITENGGSSDKYSLALLEIGLLHERFGAFENAFSSFNQALEIAKKNGNEKEIVYILNMLAASYAKTKSAHNSIRNSESALKIANNNNDFAAASEACANLANCFKALKNYEKSLEYEKLEDVYKNQLLASERKRLVTVMQANFDLTKKEIENQSLRAQEKVLKRDLKRQMWAAAFFSLAFFLALALVFLLYRFNKSRIKTNELLLEQNRAIQAQKVELEKAMSQLKSAQSHLVQSEKMASLGFLTAGIAHEINNPVNFIYSGVAGLKKNLAAMMEVTHQFDAITNKEEFDEKKTKIEVLKKEIDYEEVQEDINGLLVSIEDGAERTCSIVESLRTFSRIDASSLNKFDVNKNIDSTLVLLKTKLRDNILVEKKYDPKLPEIDSYNGQLNQVMMNILTNAIQAIGKEQGTITIETYLKEDTICISIQDSGVGMDETAKSRLFEPFYTTKEIGKGTGLGLSISYGIIKRHNGTITVDSEVTKGTKFTLELPITQEIEKEVNV